MYDAEKRLMAYQKLIDNTIRGSLGYDSVNTIPGTGITTLHLFIGIEKELPELFSTPSAILSSPTGFIFSDDLSEKICVVAKSHEFKYNLSLESILDKTASTNNDGHLDIYEMILDSLIMEYKEIMKDIIKSGSIYCPYVPIQMFRVTDNNSFQPKIKFKCRYGVVTVKDLNGSNKTFSFTRFKPILDKFKR